MDEIVDITLQPKPSNPSADISIPPHTMTVGTIGSEDIKVHIGQSIYNALEQLAASDTSKELGSILLGNYCLRPDGLHIIVSQFIEAKYTIASAFTLTFTHETWNYIHQEHQLRYPDKKIIGWQHTHPSYGIFLSSYDLFIHQNFFSLPFQVAYVIDPIRNQRGFFRWKDGKIQKLKGYFIFDDLSNQA